MQERRQSDEKTYDVVHTHPEELILNLTQLTNACLLSGFGPPCTRYPGDVPRRDLLELAVTRRAELNAAAEQKKLEKSQRKDKRGQAKQKKRTRPTLEGHSEVQDVAQTTEGDDPARPGDELPMCCVAGKLTLGPQT